uniref:CSON011097 protein n=1 Tax=Culicoides sonorensis TaxID=179676 RepID=A0A336LPX0_CULSO
METDPFSNLTSIETHFGAIDYSVFVLILSLSVGIGIYFGFFAHADSTTEEYLHGGHKMKVIPIAISLIASQLSGVTMMTVPAEMYFYGTQYYIIAPLMILITFITNSFVQVFYENNLSNCNEYLEYRFSPGVRHIIQLVYITSNILLLPIVIYIPSLAFSQVSGGSISLINAIVCGVGVFYTMFGGIKAVVWTDVLQAFVMVGSTFFIAGYSLNLLGGFGEVFSIASEGGRLELFNMQFDFTSRITFWNSSLGYALSWLAYIGLNQNCVQRMVSLPTLKKARSAMWLFCLGFIFITSLTCFTGLLIYAKYHDCDPKTVGLIQKADQILPMFVQQVVGHIPGITGIFISCVFSAGLSTISAVMNALAGIIYQDYLKPLKCIGHTERKANLWMKGIVLFFGFYCILMEVIIEKFTHLLDAVYSISALLNGPTVGIFCLGLLWPWANRKGALSGVIASVLCLSYIIIGNLSLKFQGGIKYPTLNTSIDGCSEMGLNVSQIDLKMEPIPPPIEFSLHTISFPWFALIGGAIVWIVAIPVSALTGGNNISTLDHTLLAPAIRRFFKTVDFEKGQEMEIVEKKNLNDGATTLSEQVYATKADWNPETKNIE